MNPIKPHEAYVIDSNGRPRTPCHRAIARKLIRAGRAVVLKKSPFTIIVRAPE